MAAAKGTSARVIEEASRWLGFKEGANNATPFGRRTGAPNQPWCGSFVDCVMADAGVRLPGSCVWTPGGMAAFVRAGGFRKDPLPGDVVFFDFEKGGAAVEHVGIVVDTRDWLAKRTVVTVEGNTWSGSGAFQGNGDGVYRRVRRESDIVGFGRPAYAAASSAPTAKKPVPAKKSAQKKSAAKKATLPVVSLAAVGPGKSGSAVLIVQRALAREVGLDYSSGPGVFGPRTREAYAKWQRKCGFRRSDGVPGRESLEKLGQRHGFTVH